MELSDKQLEEYQRDGFIFFPDLFSHSEVKRLVEEIAPLAGSDSPDVIWEEDKSSVRALLGCQFKSELYRNLVRQPRLLQPSTQLLHSRVYVYQFKINLKSAFKGEIWPWHQDFIYWNSLDGMPSDRVINVTVFLDECTEFNGPLWIIPGSHREGMVRSLRDDSERDGWNRDVSSDLTFKLDADAVTRLVEKGGIASPKGGAGSVLFFHPNLAHASLPNISPFQRRLLIVTYNSIDNVPRPTGAVRPYFLVNPNASPESVTEVALLIP